MQITWHECLVCGDTISNQVCFRCMQKEVDKWLDRRNPAYKMTLRRVGEFFSSYSHQGADCIMCGENLNVCSKCYSLGVHKALRRDRILASEFLDFAASKGFMLASVKGVINLER
mgnify:CR=1 FL=1